MPEWPVIWMPLWNLPKPMDFMWWRMPRRLLTAIIPVGMGSSGLWVFLDIWRPFLFMKAKISFLEKGACWQSMIGSLKSGRFSFGKKELTGLPFFKEEVDRYQWMDIG